MDDWAQRWHHCKPPQTDGDIIAAWRDGEVVGTLVIDFADADTPFPLEELYDFDIARQYLPFFSRSTTIQGGRWFAKVPNISYALFIAVAEYVHPRYTVDGVRSKRPRYRTAR